MNIQIGSIVYVCVQQYKLHTYRSMSANRATGMAYIYILYQPIRSMSCMCAHVHVYAAVGKGGVWVLGTQFSWD